MCFSTRITNDIVFERSQCQLLDIRFHGDLDIRGRIKELRAWNRE